MHWWQGTRRTYATWLKQFRTYPKNGKERPTIFNPLKVEVNNTEFNNKMPICSRHSLLTVSGLTECESQPVLGFRGRIPTENNLILIRPGVTRKYQTGPGRPTIQRGGRRYWERVPISLYITLTLSTYESIQQHKTQSKQDAQSKRTQSRQTIFIHDTYGWGITCHERGLGQRNCRTNEKRRAGLKFHSFAELIYKPFAKALYMTNTMYILP